MSKKRKNQRGPMNPNPQVPDELDDDGITSSESTDPTATESSSSVQGRIAAIQARRDRKKAAMQARRDAQYIIDLEHLADLEDEHGTDKVGHCTLERYAEGLPVMVVYRAPNSAESKRYKARLKAKKAGGEIDALDELAHSVVLYPDKEVFAQLVEERPAVLTQVGGYSLNLSYANKEAEGEE